MVSTELLAEICIALFALIAAIGMGVPLFSDRSRIQSIATAINQEFVGLGRQMSATAPQIVIGDRPSSESRPERGGV